jgi:histidyl-tRNA synthetase
MEKPSLPKGTRDFGPAQMAKRQFILNNIRFVFQKYGFMPLETPAMENLSTLTGKYGDEGDQLLFKILNSGDYLKDVDQSKLETRNSKLVTSSISEKGLRYDLTVPFARYVVMNRGEITLPFKRYQIQPVWRADRPQKGRYREFFQCDADVVGTDSLVNEAEIVLMIKEVFGLLQIKDFTIKINHRGVLAGLAETAGAKGNEGSLFVAIDKLDKIGEDKVAEELRTKGFTDENIKQVFETLKTTGTNAEKIKKLAVRFVNSENGKRGLEDLNKVFSILESYEFRVSGSGYTQPETRNAELEFDISLARGLSYYTGTIFEVKVNNVSIGSVSGGGRYDNLVEAFGSKEKLSGVGISFGIDRIYDVMEELNLFPKEAIQFTKVLIVHMEEESMKYGMRIAQSLRFNNIPTEIYPEISKVKKQLDYANKKQIPFAVIIGQDEMAAGKVALKNLITGDQESLDLHALIEKLK